ncbi:E3 ubiquitin-protein ligase RNF170 isoform X2 [Capsicum annuum]|uniref:E3 ubiquitin-protein ligase RNF170 isoform X2 n=1 Tax=Capsicum annuum TaxID=4072 RepID=UPI001FB150A9|nr:E3 ubiquitin-protein ligase RNF170 isoform X2 [Capsicum annuum]
MRIMKNPSISSSMKEEEEEGVKRTNESEKPPEDDCCPICFGNFTIPCKTNCGHWFCASCILQLWYYRSTLRRCKCPICCCLINKLVPEASLLIQQEEDVVELLKKIRRYNHLYIGGAYGFFLKVLALPLLTRRILQALMDTLMDPDQVRLNYYLMRILAEDWVSGDCSTSALLLWWPFAVWLVYTVDGCFVDV